MCYLCSCLISLNWEDDMKSERFSAWTSFMTVWAVVFHNALLSGLSHSPPVQQQQQQRHNHRLHLPPACEAATSRPGGIFLCRQLDRMAACIGCFYVNAEVEQAEGHDCCGER